MPLLKPINVFDKDSFCNSTVVLYQQLHCFWLSQRSSGCGVHKTSSQNKACQIFTKWLLILVHQVIEGK